MSVLTNINRAKFIKIILFVILVFILLLRVVKYKNFEYFGNIRVELVMFLIIIVASNYSLYLKSELVDEKKLLKKFGFRNSKNLFYFNLILTILFTGLLLYMLLIF
jgi:hypothetical protein